jgi:hypothetical protein
VIFTRPDLNSSMHMCLLHGHVYGICVCIYMWICMCIYPSRFLITFGNPEFSVWRCAAQSNLTLWYHDPSSVSKQQLELDPFYKIDGSFMLTGGRHHGIFATTDAHVSFYVQTRARSLVVSCLVSTYIYLLANKQILTHTRSLWVQIFHRTIKRSCLYNFPCSTRKSGRRKIVQARPLSEVMVRTNN